MPRLAILFLAVGLVSACAPKDTATSAPITVPTHTPPREASQTSPSPARGFRIGVAGLVPRNHPNASPDDWRDLYDNIKRHGELQGAFLLWRDAPDRAGEIPPTIQTVCALAKQNNFAPIVALGFHQQTAQGYTPALSTRANAQNNWQNKDARAKFAQVAARVAQECPASYLALGVEVNIYFEEHAADFDNFVSAYRETYDAVKAASPQTRVFTVFQLEAMKGKGYLTGRKHQVAWSLIQKFEPKLDLVAFTTYPMFDYKTPAEIPADYYAEIRKYTGKPIAFTEMGWLSQEKFSGALAALNGTGYEGSEQEQADFLARFVELTRGLPLGFALWLLPHDLASGETLFVSSGLRYNDGRPKRVWDVWRAQVTMPFFKP